MAKFLRFCRVILNIVEIKSVEFQEKWDMIEQKYTHFQVVVILKDGSSSTLSYTDRKEAVDLFNSISEKLEAVKV